MPSKSRHFSILLVLTLSLATSIVYARDKIGKKPDAAAPLAAQKPDAPDNALMREAREYLLHGNSQAALRLLSRRPWGALCRHPRAWRRRPMKQL